MDTQYSLYYCPTSADRGISLRGHVARDISPYSCIFDKCTIPDEMYVTSNDLLQHLKSEHGVRCWICEHCSVQTSNPASFTFETLKEWTTHMNTLHHDLFPEIQSAALSKLSDRIMLPPVSCPLCGYSNSHPSAVLDEHIVQHLHSFALTSLPWGLEQYDPEGDRLSDQARKPRSSTKTDMSTLSDTTSQIWQEDNTLIHSSGEPQRLQETNLSMLSHEDHRTGLNNWLQDNVSGLLPEEQQSTSQPQTRVGLDRLIRRALQTCKGSINVQSFLPDDKLAEIMTFENVHFYFSVREDRRHILHEHQDAIARHVCGQTGQSNARRASRRIFAILLLIKESRLILDFIEEGIDDGDLPLSMTRADSSTSDLGSGLDDDEGDFLATSTSDGPVIIKRFCQWTRAQKQSFYNNQWRVQVPILLKARRTPDFHPVHRFDKDIILPWIEYEEYYHGNSDLARVKVHKAHAQLGVGVSPSAIYATWKLLRLTSKQLGGPIICLEIPESHNTPG